MRSLLLLKPVLLSAILTCLAPFAHSDSITLDLQPDATNASNGDSISLDLIISGLGNFAPQSLGAFDVTVGFDASVLSLTSYSLGGSLGDLGLAEAIDASAGDLGGSVNVAEVSLLSVMGLNTLQPGSFTLATLNFDVTNLVLGTVTQLTVIPGVVLGDALGAPLTATRLGSAGVTDVPVPGTFLLLLMPFFGLLVLRSRRQPIRP